MSPPVPISVVTDAIEPLLARDVLEVGAVPVAGVVDVAHDRRDLDLVHREDHRARAAPAAELEARGCDGLERHAQPAELPRDERPEGADRRAAPPATRSGSGPRGPRPRRGRAATSSATRRTAETNSRSTSVVTVMPASWISVMARGDRVDALEHVALEHAVGELDVEGVLEREHDVDARVRGHAGLVEVVAAREGVHVGRESAVLTEHRPDLVGHDGSIGHRAEDPAITTAAARPASWVRLTAKSSSPASRALAAAAPVSSRVGAPVAPSGERRCCSTGWPRLRGRAP